jgi:hypothetical protein
MQILNGFPNPDAPTGELLRALQLTIAAQDAGGASEHFRQLAILDPARAESLVSSPALASLRPVLEQLLNQLTATAKLHAEGKLAEVAANLSSGTLRGEVRPEIFLAVATRLIEAGGLANYARSAAVCEALSDHSRWVPTGPVEATAVNRMTPSWRPLTAAWCALGVVSIGGCWWFREDWLPMACGVWVLGVAGFLLLRRRKSSH